VVAGHGVHLGWLDETPQENRGAAARRLPPVAGGGAQAHFGG
jgi:hypothetical protein